MAKKLNKEYAEELLGNVSEDKKFFVVNGPALSNIEELYNALNGMSDEQFSYHRNSEKNDFYNWVLDAIGDFKLANDLGRSKTRKTSLKKVESRVSQLKKLAGK